MNLSGSLVKSLTKNRKALFPLYFLLFTLDISSATVSNPTAQMCEGFAMRLFFDSNELTYIALFEGYICEGTASEFDAAKKTWAALQRYEPDAGVLREVEALRLLYLWDEAAHFDWLCSDIGIEEVFRITDRTKRSLHFDLLDRLIEHRRDVYTEEGRQFIARERGLLAEKILPGINPAMENDAKQYCEAVLVEADYFLTNDLGFLKAAASANTGVTVARISELPFIREGA